MSKKSFFTFLIAIVILIIGGVAYLVLRPASSDNMITESTDPVPFNDEQRDALVKAMTATTSGSLLSPKEETAIVASTSATSSKSMLTPEEEKELIDAMSAHNQ